MRLRLWTWLGAVLALALALAPASAPARSLPGTPVPPNFVGVDLDGPPLIAADHLNLARQFDLMVASGVESVRVAFSWAAAQPYQSFAQVPSGQRGRFTNVGGVPTDFSATDKLVSLAAQRHIELLPTVLYAPGWDEGANRPGGYGPPKRSGPYTAYLTALIGRYGPRGSFWSSHRPKVPIRWWQIWNEPNLDYYWPQPFAKSYVALLKAAHDAIKRADPGAQVVLGALTNRAWKFLGQVDREPGARSDYDVISVNGFTEKPAGVLLYLRYVRRAAIRDGQRSKPILASELSWPSAKGKTSQYFTWNTTEQGQASNISRLLPMLAANRSALNLIGFDYYTWMGAESPGAIAFDFAGLLRYDTHRRVVVKPALAAFTRGSLALEHCRRKRGDASRCA